MQSTVTLQNEAIRLTLMGEPIAKKRPKCGCVHGHGHVYDPQQKEMDRQKKEILWLWNNCFDNPGSAIARRASEMGLESTFDVHLTFHMGLPQSLNGGQKNSKFWGLSPCNSKPDLDNLAKFYLDCASGIVWKDDKQIVNCKIFKCYSEIPRTEMDIMSQKEIELTDKVSSVFQAFSPNEMKQLLEDMGNLHAHYSNNQTFFTDRTLIPPDGFYSKTADLIYNFGKLHIEKLKKTMKEPKK